MMIEMFYCNFCCRIRFWCQIVPRYGPMGQKKGILRPKNDLKMQFLTFKPAWLCSQTLAAIETPTKNFYRLKLTIQQISDLIGSGKLKSVSGSRSTPVCAAWYAGTECFSDKMRGILFKKQKISNDGRWCILQLLQRLRLTLPSGHTVVMVLAILH